MQWDAPQRPAELTESRLIEAIFNGHFRVNDHLPPERELAAQLGVTRPTLREALQRLARDGWIEIQHGRPTRVRNFWQEGNLGVLSAIVRFSDHLPDSFIPDLLSIRLLLAPAYARLAIQRAPKEVQSLLHALIALPEDPQAFAAADWSLHQQLTIFSGNPVFTLILNGFEELYIEMAKRYFSYPKARSRSRKFYKDLAQALRKADLDLAEQITREMMQESIALWHTIAKEEGGAA
jgi:GntR family negative regulator for fad regulon and positive regulator of fabA